MDEAFSEKELEELLITLLDMPCVTGEEGPITSWLVDRYEDGGRSYYRVGNSLIVGEVDPKAQNVALVGHLDVVPPTTADASPRREGGRIVGRGASDMKAGLAVALSCFEDPALQHGSWNMIVLAYAGEEGPPEGNELESLLKHDPELQNIDLAVILEPTDLNVQLGCVGVFHAEVRFRGTAAHSARPWLGENALTKAGEFLSELHRLEPEEVLVDGLPYQEVVTATQGWTGKERDGGTRNVVPDRFTVYVDHRFAPDKDLTAAEERIAQLVDGRAEISPVVRALGAPPRALDATVQKFIRETGAHVEVKQAWTDIARFTALGIPAVNYGPGLTAQAHSAGEYVPIQNLHRARRALCNFLSAPATSNVRR